MVLVNILTSKIKASLNKLFGVTLFKAYTDPKLVEQIRTLREYGKRGINSETMQSYDPTSSDRNTIPDVKSITVNSKEQQIKQEDFIMAVEIYKQNIPPKEQIISQYNISTPIHTSFGVAYPSYDGTQAWIVNSQGVHLVTNLDLKPITVRSIINGSTTPDLKYSTSDEQNEDQTSGAISDNSTLFTSEEDFYIQKPTITTSDVINMFYNYNGTLSSFEADIKQYANSMNITDSDLSIQEGIQQLTVVQQSSSVNSDNKNVKQPTIGDYICYINVNWRVALMWMFFMNFSAEIDFMRIVLQFTIKPIEEVINQILISIASTSILGIKPFWFLKNWIVTWYEDIVYWFAVNEYAIMCSFMRFKSNMRIGTDIGGKKFLQNIFDRGRIPFTNIGTMSTEQRKALAFVQMGYNWQCSAVGQKYTVQKIRQIIGNVLDTTYTLYTETTQFQD